MLPNPSQFSLIYSEWLLNGTLFRFADIVSSHQFCMSSLSHLSASHTATGPFTAPAVVCVGNEDMQSQFQSVYAFVCCACLIVRVQRFRPPFSLQNFIQFMLNRLKITPGFLKLDLQPQAVSHSALTQVHIPEFRKAFTAKQCCREYQ